MNENKLIVEERPCSECKHYFRPITGFPICRKKHMGVTADMRVTYKADSGTCFEDGSDTDATS